MSKIETINWHAWIDTQPGADPKLYVTGEVRTSALNKFPVLKPAVPQGINPTILLLDLSIVEEGVGGQVVTFRPARYEQRAQSGRTASS